MKKGARLEFCFKGGAENFMSSNGLDAKIKATLHAALHRIKLKKSHFEMNPTASIPSAVTIVGEFVICHGPGWLSWLPLKIASVRIYSNTPDSSTGYGYLSGEAFLKKGKMEEYNQKKTTYKLKLEVRPEFGIPGAFVIENRWCHEFFLESATLHVSQEKRFQFDCRSWVYPIKKTKTPRVFFSNTSYLPSETPEGLRKLREYELKCLRGELGEQPQPHERKEWDRKYEYAEYNDLGDPDRGPEYRRPVLGGNDKHPYPRRLKTYRPPCKEDSPMESRPVTNDIGAYIPPDERLSPEKVAELKANLIKAIVYFLIPVKESHVRPPLSFMEMIKSIRKVKEMIKSIRKGRFPCRKKNSGFHEDLSLNDMFEIFSDKSRQPVRGWIKDKLKRWVPNDELYKEIVRAQKRKGKSKLAMDLPLPSIIAVDKWAWRSDLEFGRQMVAGANPVRIRRLQELPQESEILKNKLEIGKWLHDFLPEEVKLDVHPTDEMEKEKPLDDDDEMERTLEEIVASGRIFILDHHDYLLPHLREVNRNAIGGVRAYASRTLLLRISEIFQLIPVAIELSSSPQNHNLVLAPPPEDMDQESRNFNLWDLAKTHVAANDSAHHLLVSHWLHTHAVVEPFIIATRRRLSKMHPIYCLLDPHFKDTIHINALCRAFIINAGGILERTLFTGKISMELSSEFYRKWRFKSQALPCDLADRGMDENAPKSNNEPPMEAGHPEKRGMDENAPKSNNEPPMKAGHPEKRDMQQQLDPDENPQVNCNYYPYASDGLQIWNAIEVWVRGFCEIFYKSDDCVQQDEEIQQWWKEIQEKGHADAHREGWDEMTNRENLIKALTTIIWIASALHAATNFGQYAYALTRPMKCRQFILEGEIEDFDESVFLQVLPKREDMEIQMALMSFLSHHTSDEVYLGQRRPSCWSDNEDVVKKFHNFTEGLKQIQTNILKKNKSYKLSNHRSGIARIPYKLLYPDTSSVDSKGGITVKGIPNSISI